MLEFANQTNNYSLGVIIQRGSSIDWGLCLMKRRSLVRILPSLGPITYIYKKIYSLRVIYCRCYSLNSCCRQDVTIDGLPPSCSNSSKTFRSLSYSNPIQTSICEVFLFLFSLLWSFMDPSSLPFVFHFLFCVSKGKSVCVKVSSFL